MRHQGAAVVPEVQKIAVLRANALGDMMFALPALDALRQTYPRAELVLLAQPWHQSFFARRPGPIDRVAVVPIYPGVYATPGGKESWVEQDVFFREMKNERFDLAIQLHGGGRYSNPFVRRLDARMTIGTRTPDAAPLDRWIPYFYFQPEVLRLIEVVALVGAQVSDIEPHLSLTAADLAESYQVVPAIEKPLVVLHPGASDPERLWPTERFAGVGDALAATGAQVVVTGTEGERALVRAVVEGMHAEAWDLTGKLSLHGLTGLLARSAVVVANDTGPLHLAAAVGTSTVGIYWCFNALTAAGPMTRARHRPAISWRVACPVCGIDRSRDGCQHHPSFVADIPTEEVVTSALDLLSGERERPAQRDVAS